MLTEQFLTDLFVHFLDAIHWKSVPELWTTPNGIKKEKLSFENKLKSIAIQAEWASKLHFSLSLVPLKYYLTMQQPVWQSEDKRE